MVVATDRWTEYLALSTGCNARRAFLTALGVTARFTARPGCTARRMLRGTSNREKKPTMTTPDNYRSLCVLAALPKAASTAASQRPALNPRKPFITRAPLYEACTGVHLRSPFRTSPNL